MKNLLKKLSLFLLIVSGQACLSSSLELRLKQTKALASQAQASFFDRFYKVESIRTALMRSGMVATCLADGVCSSSDLTILTLAAASLITAACYDPSTKQRYTWLPAKFNLVADGVALLASFDAGWLPITSTELETSLRTGISYLSMLTSSILFIPI